LVIARIAVLLAAIGGGGLLIAAQPPEKLTPAQAPERVGQVVTVCGTVAEIYCQSRSRTTVLRFVGLPEPATVTVVIAASDRTNFGPGIERRYQSQQMCVTGRVEALAGGYSIAASGPEQLAVEGEAARTAGDIYGACDQGVQLPQLIREVKPHYTSEAMRAKIQGTVLLQGIAGTDGAVRDIRVIRSLDPSGLDVEATRAFSQWRFQTGTLLGKPVAVIITAEMTFTLRP
jgi:TonB family protein